MRYGNASRRSGCGPSSLGRLLRRLEEPSPKSFRPLTSHVVLGHHRAGSKPTDSCRLVRKSAAHEDGFTRLTRMVPPTSPELPLERLEGPPKTPSVVSFVL